MARIPYARGFLPWIGPRPVVGVVIVVVVVLEVRRRRRERAQPAE